MDFKEYSRTDRVKTPVHHIDPGFINHRLIVSTLGPEFHKFFEKNMIKEDVPMSGLLNNHLIVRCLLDACSTMNIPTLGDILQNPTLSLFTSTEKVEPNNEVYDKKRTRSKIELPYDYDKDILIEYSTSHFVADTGKTEMEVGERITIVGGIRKITPTEIIVRPLVMGAPSFDHPRNRNIGFDLMWHGWEWYEIFPGDIDEFMNINSVKDPTPEEWQTKMKSIYEKNVKKAICEILNDIPKKDWGGELNDHFTSSLNLSKERVTAAFLLKGPSSFSEMMPSHLGKNADQIYRLSMSPASLLIVQHSHLIGEAVRATLRSFAVNPANPRRYCFIDGKDTYKLFKAYGKLN